jgi:hypothetical protein
MYLFETDDNYTVNWPLIDLDNTTYKKPTQINRDPNIQGKFPKKCIFIMVLKPTVTAQSGASGPLAFYKRWLASGVQMVNFFIQQKINHLSVIFI